ncbi:MAG: plasmid stabilization system [Caulobacteraceae bacterium]|nr:MAG: plasmid stabilization system [Caulobacteraceae bacterium]
MKVRWSRRALADLRRMNSYMAERNPRAAERMEARILDRIEALRELPLVGVLTGVGEARWVRVRRTPYLVVYRAAADELRILAVYHGSRAR